MTVAILLRRAQARPGQSDEHDVLGPCERGALVGGLRLAAGLGTDAVAVTLGPGRREDRVLAMALRAGCARAVRLGGDGFDELDYLGVAEALAAVVKRIGADVVACGDRSLDEQLGAIGPAVAELLGYAHVTGVGSVVVEGGLILCERVGDRERTRLRVKAPAVLCMRTPRLAGEAEAGASGGSGNGSGSGSGNGIGIGSGNGNGNGKAGDEDGPSERARSGGEARRGRGAPQAIDALDPEEIGLDMRRLAPRKATAGRLRPTRGPRQATLLGSAAELVARLDAEHLLPARDRPAASEPPKDGAP